MAERRKSRVPIRGGFVVEGFHIISSTGESVRTGLAEHKSVADQPPMRVLGPLSEVYKQFKLVVCM
jgi:hypothetical protein